MRSPFAAPQGRLFFFVDIRNLYFIIYDAHERERPMKAKGSANLYELLRQATGAGEAPPEGAPSEAPAAEPARPATATLTPPPAPAVTLPTPPNVEEIVRPPDTAKEPVPMPPRLKVEAPRPRPILTPAAVLAPRVPPAPAARPAAAEPPAGTGERMLHISANIAGFAALVALGLLFLAYSIGVRVGRAQASAPAPAPAPRDAAPAAPQTWTIQLMEWAARTQQEKTQALASAGELRNLVERQGFKDAQVLTVGAPGDQRVVLIHGTYDSQGEAAKAALAKLKSLKLRRTDREPTFGRTAGFVEIRR
jgi:outer membrane biosynthesis protein TonB